ncbi:MAG: hypothetical protein U5L96_15950 [Owenweeksia sp.]|nr:hypothetical protein [Owenweeksia sp.]
MTMWACADVARSLAISPGNMSYHFPRKDDLVKTHLEELSIKGQLIYSSYLDEEPGPV